MTLWREIVFPENDGLETCFFQNDSLDPSKFTFQNFFNFYHQLVGRTEVDLIFAEMYAPSLFFFCLFLCLPSQSLHVHLAYPPANFPSPATTTATVFIKSLSCMGMCSVLFTHFLVVLSCSPSLSLCFSYLLTDTHSQTHSFMMD